MYILLNKYIVERYGGLQRLYASISDVLEYDPHTGNDYPNPAKTSTHHQGGGAFHVLKLTSVCHQGNELY